MIDYSGLLDASRRRAEAPARGMASLSDALDAIMLRREREAQAAAVQRQQQEADALRRQQLEEEHRHNVAGEGEASSRLEQTAAHEKEALHQTQHDKALAAAQLGNLEEARGFDPDHFGGPPAAAPVPPAAPIPQPAGTPAAQAGIEPPAQEPAPAPVPAAPSPMTTPDGKALFVPPPDLPIARPRGPLSSVPGQLQGSPPAPSGPPPVDLATAIFQGAQRRRDANLEGWKKDMLPFVGDDPLKKDAYDYAIKAGGHLGSRETLDKTFSDRLTHLENNDVQRKTAGMRGASFAGPDEREAKMIIPEISAAVKHITAKNGLKDQVIHSQAAIQQLEQNQTNPVAWVNAIDSMIRTNTGKAAIKQQYDLYVSHAHGQVDSPETWIEKLKTGMPSAQQRANLMQALKASNAELRQQAKEEHDNFRSTYDSDPRVQANPMVKRHYQAIEHGTFGTMPGYGQGGGDHQLSAEDKAAIEMAKARLEKNPNDAVAKKVLQLHGM